MNAYLDSARIFFFVCVAFSTTRSVAQQNDSTAVEQAIDNYIVGWRLGDADRLIKAFDMDAGVVLWVDKNEDPAYQTTCNVH